MKKKFLLLALVVISFLNIKAQISQVLPLKPTASSYIDLAYDANLSTARLNKNEDIFARIINYLQDGSIEKFHKQLTNDHGKFTTTIKLPPLTASFKIEFYTLNKDDENATQSLLVYENNGTKPVKSAYLEAFFSSKVDSLFKLEYKNHPTNYLAFARYMNIIGMIKDPTSGKEQIKTLLQTLDPVIKKDRKTADLLTALCVGNAKIGELALAKGFLFELFDNYPLSAETAFSFSIYNYEYYKSSSKQIEDDVKAKLKVIFINSPKAAICKDTNVFGYLKSDLTISTAAFENVMETLYEKHQVPYYALNNLPELYIERKEKLDVAKSLLHDAVESYQKGTIQHGYRLNNGHYQMYVPFFYYDLAKIYALQNDVPSAISNASAAIQILTGSNMEGNFLPPMLKFRAMTFTKLGNYNLALADYQKAYQNGDVQVLDSLKKFFPLVNTKLKSFDEYLKSLKPLAQKDVLAKDLLPNFKGTDLKGNVISLTDLKGKIVVLNVWGIGCGPCIAEMPILNELVKDFKDKPEVVFIAVTGDQKNDLIKFFKTRSFDYKVLANVQQITETFNTNALPVHMIIGRKGEILNRSIGARDDIKAYLKGVIETNL